MITRFITISVLLLITPLSAYAQNSICYGTTSNGHLEHGVELPSAGANFVGYSTVARLAGRTYVHSSVKDIMLAAYKDLEKGQPTKVYKYAETGFEEGGQFKPHKTHRNGLSVDFMTPVIDENNVSVHLPTHPLNKFGYDIEFDKDDEYEGLSIDYEAIAAHIVALHKQAKAAGYHLWRVILAPELQPNLYTTPYGPYLNKHITFSKKRSWVRHDEHYHVDFAIPCSK
jgi:penicillin-insensitive murein endopeptidase